MKNKMLKIIPLLLSFVLLSICVNAFAISKPHLEDDKIMLYPGESSVFEITLQNMVGDTDELVQVSITGGSEIARIIDYKEVYELPKGTKDTKVRIGIEIPDDSPLGTEYGVVYKANLVAGGGGGMIPIAQGLSSGFTVRVGPEPEQKPLVEEKSIMSTWWVLGGMVLAVLIALALVYYKKKKK